MSKDLTAEAVRLLLEAEWRGNLADPDGDCGCVYCNRVEIEGHAPDCRLVTLLKKAGVRE